MRERRGSLGARVGSPQSGTTSTSWRNSMGSDDGGCDNENGVAE